MNINPTKIPSPCFVLEEKLLKENLKKINYVSENAGVKIILALKGFSMFSTFGLIKESVPGVTASSLNEALLGKEEFGGEVHAYAPAYLPSEFEKWCVICQHITFNSLNQWEQFKSVTLSHGVSPGLRINPEYSEVKTELYNPCVPGSRLGIRAEQLQSLPEDIEGLHFHNLCENNSFALENTLKSVKEKFGHLLNEIKWLNLGGGHLITHKDYNTEHLITTLKDFKKEFPKLEIIMEPGAAFAWQTGYLLATVLDIIESDGLKVIIPDISVSAHMPDCIEMPYKPQIYGASDPKEGQTKYRIGGLTCLAGDQTGDYHFEKPPVIGDHLIFMDMMHYTMVKTTTFNGVNLPSIGIWKEDNSFEMQRAFGYEDYKGRLS